MRSEEDDERIVVVVDPQFRELVDEINKGIDERFRQHDDRVDRRFGAFEERLDDFEERQGHRLRMHFDAVQELIKLAAEGYGGTLESIDRRLDRLETKVDRNFRQHSAVLADHARRLGRLERKG